MSKRTTSRLFQSGHWRRARGRHLAAAASAVVEQLEQRRMLAVSASVSGSTLNVTTSAADNVVVNSSAGQVKINGANPSTGAFASGSLTNIAVTCNGTFANAIDLSAVNAAAFGSINRTTVTGGGRNDTVFGSQFADDLRRGDGNDSLVGNDGNDTLIGGTGANILDAGAGDDIMDLSGGTATVNPGDGTDTPTPP